MEIKIGADYYCGFTGSALKNRDLPFLKDAGIQMVRIEFSPRYESAWSITVPILTDNGIEVLGLLMRRDLIRNIDAWGDWVYNTVLTWKDRVKIWEVWNEPNWRTGFEDNPVGYTRFLQRAYERAKEADPTCVILAGGNSGVHEGSLNYYRQVYDAGGKDYFDALAVHPYCGPNPPEYPHANSWPSGFWMIERWRAMMDGYGDADKKIWVTEMGWTTPPGTYPVSEEEQAQYLVRALQMALDWGWLEGFIIFNWMDSRGANLYYGLVYIFRGYSCHSESHRSGFLPTRFGEYRPVG